MAPDRDKLDDLVRRIVEAVQPLSIILFGSAARDEMGPDSDLDVLVVMPDGTHRRQTAQHLHTRMFGLGVPVDILVATPRDLDRHRDNIGLIYHTILKEGRVIYAA
ncbi:MAG: nucleotidyltransferase domain-containing protein [Bacteroidota bacterium]